MQNTNTLGGGGLTSTKLYKAYRSNKDRLNYGGMGMRNPSQNSLEGISEQEGEGGG